MDMPAAAPVLQAEGIGVRFGGVTALAGVSLDLVPGEVCGLIGPNGAGKTTLFDVLSGIRAPSEGAIRLDGRSVGWRSPTWRSRHGVRRTFQRQQTFGWLSVEDNVLIALDWRGGGGGMVADLVRAPTRRARERVRRERVNEVLERCGLTDVQSDPAGALPIGRARLVELARAIADAPRVLLLDEPTSGLDEHDAERLGQVMRSVAADDQCAVVLVEHDVGFVMHHCDRIVVLHLGAVIAEGAPDVIRNNAAVGAAYLG
jgi:branched-chain amino acid transport system ATP-binding protein